ncbi:GNAT family N-acetyltransferase [Brevibacillus sp. SYSU BS000544]|uniref:GNAT family N-acetyltransferase n=1 Tax=Brevibacillus sp. SYSU BS000544 TaxID=3416443 RepID=UPI003CE4494D
MKVLETERLVIRWFSPDDAAFILELLNEPSWIQFIGDRGVRTLDDARAYIINGPVAMYAREGFGLYLTERKDTGEPIGMCGLIKRDTLEDVDIGFAFLPKHWSQGFAYESASSVLEYGKDVLNLKRIVAITNPDNHPSGKLLERLGFQFERKIRLAEDQDELRLFGINW